MSKIYGIGDEEELAEDLQKELPNRIIEELERVNEKIESYYYTNDPDEMEIQYNLALADIQYFICKRISELKGE